ncbi:hypothetical protein [Staphylospora marina]|uniref:hypothetical protein n=1 Tax=Staphylospora marina TaxID=2490858 RepID=UPI0013DE415F|nr:hypothetical protein [Staphylospora marina]
MLHALIAAKEELLARWNKKNEYEELARNMQKLKQDMELLGMRPKKEKLYGRPYRD